MRLLLDSHVALWLLSGSPEIGPVTHDAIVASEFVAVSVVTPWELGIKKALGKLNYPTGLVKALQSSGLKMLPIDVHHAERAPRLPPHHRDPFDRMLIAQAIAESLTFVTADSQIGLYKVTTLDART